MLQEKTYKISLVAGDFVFCHQREFLVQMVVPYQTRVVRIVQLQSDHLPEKSEGQESAGPAAGG